MTGHVVQEPGVPDIPGRSQRSEGGCVPVRVPLLLAGPIFGIKLADVTWASAFETFLFPFWLAAAPPRPWKNEGGT
jgi:hypothetical protein